MSRQDYKALMKYRNDHNYFAKAFGLMVTRISEGEAESRVKVTGQLYNPINSIHGGCLYTIADVTCGAAVASYGMMATTMQSSMSYLRPGMNCMELIGRAKVIKHGKNISVVNVDIMDQDEVVLAQGVFQFMSLGREIVPDEKIEQEVNAEN